MNAPFMNTLFMNTFTKNSFFDKSGVTFIHVTDHYNRVVTTPDLYIHLCILPTPTPELNLQVCILPTPTPELYIHLCILRTGVYVTPESPRVWPSSFPRPHPPLGRGATPTPELYIHLCILLTELRSRPSSFPGPHPPLGQVRPLGCFVDLGLDPADEGWYIAICE